MPVELYSVIALTILFSAIFSGVEIAFVSANKLKIELDKNKGIFPAKIISWFNKHSSSFIVMLLVGNNISLVIYGIYAEQILDPWLLSFLPNSLQSHFFLLLIQTVIATLVILVIAEFLPKAAFRINPNRILNFFAFPLIIIYSLLFPLVISFIKISEWLLKYVFRYEIKEKDYSFTSADLDHFIREFSHEKSEQNAEPDLQIFQNAIDFKDVKIRECLIPRTEVVGIELDVELQELIKLFVESGHSKVVVYKENLDTIIGYVHSFDLFQKPESIKSILRNVIFVPETMQANLLLNKLIKQNQSIAVVLDEFGGTAGIITLEDLMEEIFGEIDDEFDTEELVEKVLDDDTYIFSSRIEIDYINQKYDLKIEVSGEYETLGGFIISQHENIPKKGEKILIQEFEFEILQATESKIELVQLQVISE